jgi:hypothetical protein
MIEKDSWVYRSGDIWLPKEVVDYLHTYVIGNETTRFYVNYWHGMHLLSGIVFGLIAEVYRVKYPVLIYIVLHTLWELWQLSIGMTVLTLRGCIDILTDTGMGLLGVFLRKSIL